MTSSFESPYHLKRTFLCVCKSSLFSLILFQSDPFVQFDMISPFGSEALAAHFQQVAEIQKNISLHIAHFTTFRRKTGMQTSFQIIMKGMHTRKSSISDSLDSPVHLLGQGSHFRCQQQRPPDRRHKGL